ncbi:MAG TPA: ABC transporter permease, partial [Desulfobacterales bacterium]|nr:ABC transporter permease [Desulfobacterales bacterium]
GLPVTRMIGQRIEPTLWLTFLTITFAVVFAVPMGVIAAWKAGTWIDRALMALAVLAFSLPVFLIGYLFIFGFSIQLAWLPVQGFRSLSEGFVPFIRHLILPAASGGLVYMALIARMTRATMLEVLSEDYIRTARARGVGSRRLLMRHALKNAAVPIVTTIGLGIALLLGGVIVTESVFAIPGIGRLTVDSVLRHDYPVIQGIVLVVASAYVFINLAVDLLYTVLDPRIRY